MLFTLILIDDGHLRQMQMLSSRTPNPELTTTPVEAHIFCASAPVIPLAIVLKYSPPISPKFTCVARIAMTHTSKPSAFVPPALSSLPERLNRASSVTLAGPSSFTSPPPVAASAPTTLTHPLAQRLPSRRFSDASFGKGSGTVVVLFRGDLRVHDHPALTHALEEASTVIPVYVFDTRQFGTSPAGFQKTGKYRARFLRDSVRALREQFKSLGGNLIVRTGLPEEIIPKIVRQTRAKRVFVHKEISTDEQRVERSLHAVLDKAGASVQRFWSNTLYYEDDLPFTVNELPDVYTDFREKVRASARLREPLPAPQSVPALPAALDEGVIPSLAELGIADIADTTRPSSGGMSELRGGEREALARLSAFANDRYSAVNEYAGERSGKDSCVNMPDFACQISPWLALGCISPRLIFDEMKRCGRMPAKILSSCTYYELLWRDFFRYITCKYSQKRVGAGNSAVAAAV